MVAADADGVPARHLLHAEFESVDDKAHGGLGRKDESVLCHIFFEDVILYGAAQFVQGNASFSGIGQIHCPDNRCRSVDGHRGGYLVKRDAIKQHFHIS